MLIHDQQEMAIQTSEQNRKVTNDLLDKLIAMARPESLRELRRDPASQPKVPGPPARPNFPGFRPDLRPPSPPVVLRSTPKPLEPAQDKEAVDALNRAVQLVNG